MVLHHTDRVIDCIQWAFQTPAVISVLTLQISSQDLSLTHQNIFHLFLNLLLHLGHWGDRKISSFGAEGPHFVPVSALCLLLNLDTLLDLF